MLSPDEVLKQSQAAMGQWESKWKEQAKINGELYHSKFKNSHKDLLYKEAGKTFLCVAYAPSFEDNIELLKKHKDNPAIVIGCVDKCLGDMVKHGITPKYVFLADAGIDYEKWCEPYLESTKDITLVCNITTNPKWPANWKGDVFFYVNKDNIESEKIFSEISNFHETIPASSNVGNSVLVFATQLLGADEYLLLGYDYCFGAEDNYYAFNDNDKRYWMSHTIAIDNIGRVVNTSQNLLFSARWLSDFYTGYLMKKGIRAFNCSGKGILHFPQCSLKAKLDGAGIRKLTKENKQQIINARMKSVVVQTPEDLTDAIEKLNVNHAVINHLDQQTIELLEAI